MSDLEINRTIHEAMGQRWIIGPGNYMNPVYTCNWDEYGPMLEWAMEQNWWEDFTVQHAVALISEGIGAPLRAILNPRKGSTALAEFIKTNPELFERGDIYDPSTPLPQPVWFDMEERKRKDKVKEAFKSMYNRGVIGR